MKKNYLYLGIIFLVVGFHLIQVNIIDSITTEYISHDFADDIQKFEGNSVYWFSQHWNDLLVYFFVSIYIVIYPFTLWFSPLYYVLNNEEKSMKTLSFGLLFIYLISLPFYLFLPLTNVYRYYNLNSALEHVIPGCESFFYATTTSNNCLPSLHTAMTIIIAYTAYLTGNKKYFYFTLFCMITVLISVIYLSIHWISDVIVGGVVSLGVILILQRYFLKKRSG